MTKDNFLLYGSFYDAICDLPESEQLKAFHALCRYGLHGEVYDEPGVVRGFLRMAMPNIDAAHHRYEVNTANGKKGGRPKKTETQQEPNNNPTETETEPTNNPPLNETQPNSNHNDNVNANVDDNANDNKSTTKVVGTPTKRISLKDQLVNYVNELEYSEETKKALFDWIFQIGLNGKVSVKQLQDKLDSIRKVYSDESLIRESIREAYRNNWFGFFPVKNKPTVSPAVLEKKEPSSFTNIPQDNSYNTNQQFQPQPYKKGGLNFIY